jgi:hypothetical protein
VFNSCTSACINQTTFMETLMKGIQTSFFSLQEGHAWAFGLTVKGPNLSQQAFCCLAVR